MSNTSNTALSTMKLSKTMGEVLYELFGPNGQKTAMVTTDSLRYRAFKELERHGIVTIRRATAQFECLMEVRRAIDGATLCEVFTKDQPSA